MSGRLEDPEEHLLRQVHPAFVQGGRPTSQAFTPTANHDYQLSVDRGSKTTAADAFKRYTKEHESIGVWAFTVAEAEDANVKAYDDPREDNRAHARVDFKPLSNNKRKAAGKLLLHAAQERGPVYQERGAPGEG